MCLHAQHITPHHLVSVQPAFSVHSNVTHAYSQAQTVTSPQTSTVTDLPASSLISLLVLLLPPARSCCSRAPHLRLQHLRDATAALHTFDWYCNTVHRPEDNNHHGEAHEFGVLGHQGRRTRKSHLCPSYS
jgi:hypothetical protein